MKIADFPAADYTVRPAETNGTNRITKRSGAPKDSPGTGAPADAPAAEPLAPPVMVAAGFMDAPMWPLHSAVWFQPDVAPSAPVWTGLGIERHKRIPIPDFLPSGIGPLNCPVALDNSRHALAPAASPTVPQSDLAPLGWDARANCREEGCE
jgi:hypothetical protein